jgi:hypothetical protein
MIDYVHLNPIRAGIINATTESLLDYPWSSLSEAMLWSGGVVEWWSGGVVD